MGFPSLWTTRRIAAVGSTARIASTSVAVHPSDRMIVPTRRFSSPIRVMETVSSSAAAVMMMFALRSASALSSLSVCCVVRSTVSTDDAALHALEGRLGITRAPTCSMRRGYSWPDQRLGWHLGQKVVPLPSTTERRNGAAQRAQGSPARP